MKGKILFLSTLLFLTANGTDVSKSNSVGGSCLRRRGADGVWHRVGKSASEKIDPQKNNSEFIDVGLKLVCGGIPACEARMMRSKIE